MTKEEKLKAVIEKAIEGGLDNAGMVNVKRFPETLSAMEPNFRKVVRFSLLMSHDFARAFFSDGHEDNVPFWECDKPCSRHDGLIPTRLAHWHLNWQQHLQRAVLSEDPLDYYFQQL